MHFEPPLYADASAPTSTCISPPWNRRQNKTCQPHNWSHAHSLYSSSLIRLTEHLIAAEDACNKSAQASSNLACYPRHSTFSHKLKTSKYVVLEFCALVCSHGAANAEAKPLLLRLLLLTHGVSRQYQWWGVTLLCGRISREQEPDWPHVKALYFPLLTAAAGMRSSIPSVMRSATGGGAFNASRPAMSSFSSSCSPMSQGFAASGCSSNSSSSCGSSGLSAGSSGDGVTAADGSEGAGEATKPHACM